VGNGRTKTKSQEEDRHLTLPSLRCPVPPCLSIRSAGQLTGRTTWRKSAYSSGAQPRPAAKVIRLRWVTGSGVRRRTARAEVASPNGQLARLGIADMLLVVAIATSTWNRTRVVSNLTVSDLMLVATMGVALLTRISEPRKATLNPPYRTALWILAAVIVWLTALDALLGNPIESNGLRFAGTVSLMACLAALMSPSMAIESKARVFVAAGIFGATFNAVAALAGVSAPGFYSRYSGLSDHPVTLGVAAGIWTPAALFLALEQRPRASRLLYGGCTALLIAGVAATGSRGALLALAVPLSVLAWPELRRIDFTRWIWLMLGLTMAYLARNRLTQGAAIQRLLRPNRYEQASNTGRETAISDAFGEWTRSPLRGAGFGSIRTAHNLPLELLRSGGVVLALAVAFVTYRIFTTMRSAASTPMSRLLRIVLFGTSAQLLFQTNLWDRFFWLVIILAAEHLGSIASPRQAATRATDHREWFTHATSA
jgi:AcrR family transcriptional regulator